MCWRLHKSMRSSCQCFGKSKKIFLALIVSKIRIPHPISLAGMVYMGDAYLPINQHWRQFYQVSNIASKRNVPNSRKTRKSATSWRRKRCDLSLLLRRIWSDSCEILKFKMFFQVLIFSARRKKTRKKICGFGSRTSVPAQSSAHFRGTI